MGSCTEEKCCGREVGTSLILKMLSFEETYFHFISQKLMDATEQLVRVLRPDVEGETRTIVTVSNH